MPASRLPELLTILLEDVASDLIAPRLGTVARAQDDATAVQAALAIIGDIHPRLVALNPRLADPASDEAEALQELVSGGAKGKLLVNAIRAFVAKHPNEADPDKLARWLLHSMDFTKRHLRQRVRRRPQAELPEVPAATPVTSGLSHGERARLRDRIAAVIASMPEASGRSAFARLGVSIADYMKKRVEGFGAVDALIHLGVAPEIARENAVQVFASRVYAKAIRAIRHDSAVRKLAAAIDEDFGDDGLAELLAIAFGRPRRNRTSPRALIS